MYVNEYFYCFVKNFFCKPGELFFKKQLTFFTHTKGSVISQGLFSGNCQTVFLNPEFVIAKILNIVLKILTFPFVSCYMF